MKIYDILNEDGRIVKGVNTTVDVGPNEIKTQAAKFGNTVDKDGRPPTLSKKVKGKSTNVLFNLGLTEGTDKIPVKAGHVLFSDWAKDHIAEHNEPGIGSVFASNINIEQLTKIIETLPVQGQGGPYTTKVPGIGYNLVLPYEQAKSLPDAQETTVEKQERGQKFDAPAFKTSAPISQFKTDILTLIIVPSNPQYLPDDVKQDKEILNSIQRKESYSIVTAFPGDPDIPPVSQWNNRYAVVIPDQPKPAGDLFTQLENFADGKKKGKSRPGRVKKSGASCNGSVTALRKRAKKASGEKAKMYHWCANMKSGKK